jgi:hypothetical protein
MDISYVVIVLINLYILENGPILANHEHQK